MGGHAWPAAEPRRQESGAGRRWGARGCPCPPPPQAPGTKPPRRKKQQQLPRRTATAATTTVRAGELGWPRAKATVPHKAATLPAAAPKTPHAGSRQAWGGTGSSGEAACAPAWYVTPARHRTFVRLTPHRHEGMRSRSVCTGQEGSSASSVRVGQRIRCLALPPSRRTTTVERKNHLP